ncbi:2-acyl-glycerophospho-ethanolamine acyltransferase [Anaerohalosphaera lusitana]|uniref:2-acyl-glycerophospho-ethanolamine acyltransferase n=1 Tax=Anaerohalosphaera lusitana TaxID=1936003 RepID=A0A1U9NJQ4_9BACT|nr:lysophospholipid acyltransferase family protein [Anaerohalosphaera lusitana]AQT68045.1 2-acyl-glycerophospho-ethanolamine acyltransferase [Anaerohalosphaera lusitana]
MKTVLRYIWFQVLIKPLVLVVLGLNIRDRSRLHKHKQMILVANHNSHLDTMVLMSLFPFKRIQETRPVAATDYFYKSRLRRWFADNIIQIVPVQREIRSVRLDPLASCSQALKKGQSLILYPEGTRGEPEKLENFKTGIAHLSKRFPEIPVVPIFCHGLGKALPKGDFLLVPFYCDIFIGPPIYWQGNRNTFMKSLNQTMQGLAEQGNFKPWD